MARILDKLTPKIFAQTIAAAKPGFYGDGGGLWLRIAPGGSASWVFRYRSDKARDNKGNKPRDMSLGPCHTITLAEARRIAAECRAQRLSGLDPIEHRKRQREAAQLLAARQISFAEAATQYIDAMAPSWTNEKHVSQWRNTLDTYANVKFGDKPVADVTTEDVLQALRPIWETRHETASRVQARIASVLDWATVKHLRTGDNPARWTGHLEHLLANISTEKHYPALPLARMGVFMLDLRQQGGTAARALEFLILCASRSGEVRGAVWEEVDLVGGIWTIPAKRMKGRREHRVPLSKPALDLLKQRHKPDATGLIFHGSKPRAPMSDMTLTAVVRRMNKARTAAGLPRWQDAEGVDVVVHGFRSCFSDWAGDMTDYARDLRELALAHRIDDKTEAAYRRSDMIEKRRTMMGDWADFVLTDVRKADRPDDDAREIRYRGKLREKIERKMERETPAQHLKRTKEEAFKLVESDPDSDH